MGGKAVWCKKCHSVIWIHVPPPEKAEEPAGKKIGFVITPELPIILEGELIAGRDLGCDIKINNLRASRRHARFFQEGELFLVEDLGSRNGISVDGIPVTRAELCNNARVHVGGVDLIFGIADSAGEIRQRFRNTRILRRKEETQALSQELLKFNGDDFKGNLCSINSLELCQFIRACGRTGTLSISAGAEEQGEVYFRSGIPVLAKTKNGDGDKAFLDILAFRNGSFVFQNGERKLDGNLGHGLDFYLIETARREDETHCD
jgi:hypothetical protein